MYVVYNADTILIDTDIVYTFNFTSLVEDRVVHKAEAEAEAFHGFSKNTSIK